MTTRRPRPGLAIPVLAAALLLIQLPAAGQAVVATIDGAAAGQGTGCDPNPAHLPCDVPNPGVPGCADPACCQLVCELVSPLCCLESWDQLCADAAVDLCAGGHPNCPGPGDCFEPQLTPGCADEACCNLVCQGDPFCCDVVWDNICVQQALKLCVPPPICGGPDSGDCCTANGTRGCDDAECCDLVCSADEFCCDIAWDTHCALIAAELCDQCPAICGDPAAGDCCTSSNLPGCNDPACCEQVCLVDPLCCEVSWTDLCAGIAAELCADCAPPPPACGDASAGDCCAGHDEPSCNDAACCQSVCAADPFCCTESWDQACAARAGDLCGDACGAGTPCPWDCDGSFDGLVGILDFLRLLAEWGQVGTLCDFLGDGVGILDFLELLANWGPCTEQDCEVNLTIYKGQGGAAVPDDEEENPGSFTVANLNDTDCDGTVDNADNSVKDTTGNGRDEVDLMKIVLEGSGPETKTVELRLLGGSAKVWEESTKETEVALPKKYGIPELPKRLWVEATAASGSLRDIELELVCQDWNVSDKVNATGVWATVTAVAHDRASARSLLGDPDDPNNNGDPDWNDMTDPPKNFVELYDGVGLRPVDPNYGVKNVIEIKFTIVPSGIHNEACPAFDGSRRVEGKMWHKTGAADCVVRITRTFPAKCEEANDDSFQGDKSAAPNADDEYFDHDAPGKTSDAATADLSLWRFNFKEFLRMSTNGVRPSGNLKGSRCSPFYDWHVRHRLVKDAAGKWARSGGEPPETADNDIGPGHVAVGTCP